MTKTQTVAKILAFLLVLCLRFSSCAIAQTQTSSGIWWGFQRSLGGNDVWQSPQLTASVPQFAKPNSLTTVYGKNFTIKDSMIGKVGRVVVSGVADQSSFKLSADVSINSTGYDTYVSYFYDQIPDIYVEGDKNSKFRITVEVNSTAFVKTPPNAWGDPGATVDCFATRDFGTKDYKRRGAYNAEEGNQFSDSFKSSGIFGVTDEFGDARVVNREGYISPYGSKWPFGGRTQLYVISGMDIDLKLKLPNEATHFSAKANKSDEVVMQSLKQDLIVTIERIGPTRPAETAIGVDFNRDGAIDYDKADKTSAAKPFDFWLNTDCEADEEQENPPTKVQDCADGVISSKRDLEDFSRLHIQAPAAFRPDGTWKCKLHFVGATGSPAIRLFPAASPGTEYLTKPNVATKQIGIRPNLVVGSTPVEVPLSLFKSDGANKFRAALLFEALKAGKGALQITFTKAGKEQKAKNPVYLDLRPIKDFYDYYLLPAVDLNGVTTNYNHPSATAKDIAASQTSDYILFVHGWRMQEWKKQVFAETSFKRLWQRGYKGKFGFFSWPTDYTALNPLGIPIDEGNYNRSERRAWLSAAALHSLLVSLSRNSSQKVHVFAHSMGNVVTSEALLLEAQSPAPKKIVQTYVATQAATVAQAYDSRVEGSRDQLFHGFKIPNIYKSYPLTALPYFEHGGMRLSVGKMINYFNERDYALNNWGWGQLLKKPESGAYSDVYDYGYDSTKTPGPPEVEYGFYRETRAGNPKQRTQLLFPDDRYEIFAHAAPAFSLPLGRQEMPIVAGLFSENVNLEAGPFNFTGDRADHSAQFNSDLMTRYHYWDQLMKSFGMNVSPPK